MHVFSFSPTSTSVMYYITLGLNNIINGNVQDSEEEPRQCVYSDHQVICQAVSQLQLAIYSPPTPSHNGEL